MYSTRPYLSIREGNIIVDYLNQEESFPATEEGAKEVLDYLYEQGEAMFSCSSSIDFPTEYGGEAVVTNILRGV